MDIKDEAMNDVYGPSPDEEELEEDLNVEEPKKKWTGKKLAILAGAGIVAATLVVAGCMRSCGGREDSVTSMQSVFEEYLGEDGAGIADLDSLSEANREKVVSTAIATLEKLIGDGSSGYDRQTIVSELEKVLQDMGLSLTNEEIHNIAEKFVDLYLSHYEEAYTDIEKTNNSIKQLAETVMNELKENLYTITDYLTQLDSEIVNNQTTLEEVIQSGQDLDSSLTEKTDAIQNQISGSLTEIKNEFATVNGQLTASEEKLEAFYAKYDKNSESINNSFKNVQAGIAETKEQISTTEKKITEALSEMENKNGKRQEETSKKLTEAGDSIKATQEQLKKTEQAVLDAISGLGNDMDKNQKELAGILEEMEGSLQKTLSENMVSINKNFADLGSRLAEVVATLQAGLDAGVQDLKAQMESIHEQIITTQGEITDTLAALEEKQDLQYEDLMSAINNAVARINTNMETAHRDLQVLIENLRAEGEENHAETLEKLTGMEGSLAASMENSLNLINASFSDLNMSLKDYFIKLEESQGAGQEEIGSAIGQLGDNIGQNQQVIRDELAAHDSANLAGQKEIRDAISRHSEEVTAGQTGLNASIGTHNENVRGYIDSLKSFLQEKLDSVFTFVSNGKKGLASALLTKGVTVKEDATFSELKDAILNVPQKLVIGVEQIPGEIEYEYHYHVDASGNRVGEMATNDVEGGCYTVAVYHTHNDSCYNWSHEHNDHCKSHPIWVDWDGDGYWGKIYDCGDQPANVRGSLKCTLPTSDDGRPIYYELGCGLGDGQIVAAHIVYEPQAVNAKKRSRILSPAENRRIITENRKEEEMPERMETQEPEGQGEEEMTESSGQPTETETETPPAGGTEETGTEEETVGETETSPETEAPSETETFSEMVIPSETETALQAGHGGETEEAARQETAARPETDQAPQMNEGREADAGGGTEETAAGSTEPETEVE